MTFSEMPIGTTFELGGINYANEQKKLVWTKISNDKAICNLKRMRMDARRSTSGTSRVQRIRGFNFFPETHLFKWLNSSTVPSYNTSGDDERPYFYGDDGFLSCFEQEELDFLIPWKMTTIVPQGFQKKFGKSYTVDTLVGIPSISDLTQHEVTDGYLAEKSVDEVDIFHPPYDTMTRSGTSQTLYAYKYGDPAYCTPVDGANVCPIISIRGDAPFMTEGASEIFCSAVIPKEDLELQEGLLAILGL